MPMIITFSLGRFSHLSLDVNVGTSQTGYDKTDTRPVLSRIAQVMLAKYGSQISAKSGVVRLVRG